MKALKPKLETPCLILAIVCTISIKGQNSHDELNGLYCNSLGQYISFKNGKMDWYKTGGIYSEKLIKQEHYDYNYENREIIYKYKDFKKLNFNGNKIMSIDNRGRMYYRATSIGKIIEIVSSLNMMDLYKKVVEKSSISMQQFSEIIVNEDFLSYSDIKVDEFFLEDFIINTYKNLKRTNRLQNKDIIKQEPVKTSGENSNETIKSSSSTLNWSDWAMLHQSGDTFGSLIFSTYLFAGKENKIKNLIGFNPRRGKDIEVEYLAILYKDNQIIGRANRVQVSNKNDFRKLYLPNAKWHKHSSGFNVPPSERKDPRISMVPLSELKNGVYKIKITVKEKNGTVLKKSFKFKINEGNISSNNTVSESRFMKKHKLHRIEKEKEMTFLVAE